jgi:uncharacterized heparinase superfamily protein
MQARLWLASVRHTHRRQLAARLGLTIKRKALEAVPALGDARAVVPAGKLPPLAPDPPPPVFPARSEVAELRGGRWRARFLGHDHAITPPVTWEGFDLPHGTPLGRLTVHYMEFLEGVDDTAFGAIVADWIARNPPYRKGYWKAAWNAYAVSIRTVVWMQQWVARRFDATLASRVRILGSLARQLAFLERNLETDIGGNHILKNAKALLWAGRFFSGEAAERWCALGRELLAREVEAQLLPDGMHFERSPAYHAQVTADLLESWAVHPEGAEREKLADAVTRAAQALSDLTHPDGTPSLFNDGALHMTYPPAVILDAVERHLRLRPDARGVFALDAAGYYGARGPDTLVLVDCGAIGPDHLPAHAHGDVLSFEWSAGGRRVIVDTGVLEYNAGPARARSRSTSAHNTLTLDDHDQAEFWSAFRVGRRPRVAVDRFETRPDGFVLEGRHDGYAGMRGAPRHVRRFDVSSRTIRVEDRVEGGAGQRACARLLLAPGLDCVRDDRGLVIACDGVGVRLQTTAAVSVVAAPYWPDFGVEIPVRQIVLDYGTAPCAGGFALEWTASP